MANPETTVQIDIRTKADVRPVEQMTGAVEDLWETIKQDQVKVLTEQMGLTPDEAAAAGKVLDAVKAEVEDLAKGGPESLGKFAEQLEAKLAPAMQDLEKKVLARREQEYQAHRKRMEAWKREEMAQDVKLAEQAAGERREIEERETRERLARNNERVLMAKALEDAEQMRREQNTFASVGEYDPKNDARMWRERAAGASAFGAATQRARGSMGSLNATMQQAAYLADDMQYGWRAAANNLMMVAAGIPVVGGAVALAIPVIGVFIDKLSEADDTRMDRLRGEVDATKESIADLGDQMRETFDTDLEQWEQRVIKSMEAYKDAMRTGAEEKARLDAKSQAALDLELMKLEVDKQSIIANLGEDGDRKAIDAHYKRVEDALKRKAAEDAAAREVKVQSDNLQRSGNGQASAQETIRMAEAELKAQRAMEDDVRARMSQAGVQSDQESLINRFNALQTKVQNPDQDPEQKAKDLDEMDAMRWRYGKAKQDLAAGRQTYDEAAKGEGMSDDQKAQFATLKAELDNVKSAGEASARVLEEARQALTLAQEAQKAAEAALEVARIRAETVSVKNELARRMEEEPASMVKQGPTAEQKAIDEQMRADDQAAGNAEITQAAGQLDAMIGAATNDEFKAKLEQLRATLTDSNGATAADVQAIQNFLSQIKTDDAAAKQMMASLARSMAESQRLLLGELKALHVDFESFKSQQRN